MSSNGNDNEDDSDDDNSSDSRYSKHIAKKDCRFRDNNLQCNCDTVNQPIIGNVY